MDPHFPLPLGATGRVGLPCQSLKPIEFHSKPQDPRTWDYSLQTIPDSVSPTITEGLPLKIKILLPPQPKSPNRHRGQEVCDGPASLWIPRPTDSLYLTLPLAQASRSGFHEALCSKFGLVHRGTMSLLGVPSSSFDKSRGHMRRFIDFSWYQEQGAQHTVWVRLELSPSLLYGHSANILLGPAGIVLPLSTLLVIRLPQLQVARQQDGCLYTQGPGTPLRHLCGCHRVLKEPVTRHRHSRPV